MAVIRDFQQELFSLITSDCDNNEKNNKSRSSGRERLIRKHDKDLDKLGDFSFPSTDQAKIWGQGCLPPTALQDRLTTSTSDFTCSLPVRSVSTPGGSHHLVLRLDRQLTMQRYFGGNYPGSRVSPATTCESKSGGKLQITNTDKDNSSEMTKLRTQFIGECLSAVAQICPNRKSIHYVIGNSGSTKIGKQSDEENTNSQKTVKLQVGPVLGTDGKKDETTKFTSLLEEVKDALDDLDRERGEENDQGKEARLSELSLACIKFHLLYTSPIKSVSLPPTPGDLATSSLSSPTFILYNSARITQILNRYDENVRTNIYPAPPPIDSVNWSLLSESEEWEIFFNYLLSLGDLLTEISEDSRKIYKIPQHLASLAGVLSRYYSRVKVLREPVPSLLPVIHARVYFLRQVQEYIHLLLSLLGLQPLKKM